MCLAGMSFGAFAQTHVEGAEYYKADQLDNAKELLTRSLSNAGTDKAVSNYYLGLIALKENNRTEAAKYFSNGTAANPDYPFNYVGQGMLKLLSGDQKGAEVLFKQAEKLSKKDASLDIAIARAYDNVDPVKYEKQVAKYVANARKHDMKNPDIYLFEGDQFREAKGMENIGKAANMYEMATGYDNQAAAAYVKYANLFTMVNPDFAIKMLQNLLSVNPNSALGQRELANAYYNKGNYALAAKEYGKYVQNPSHFKSDENRYSFLLYFGEDYKKGYDFATNILKQNPKDFTARRYQFMNAAQLPEMKDQLLAMAENVYAEYKANPKENLLAPIDFSLISDQLQTNGRIDDAIDMMKLGIETYPDKTDFRKALAFLYIDKSDFVNAADALEDLIEKTDEPSYGDYIRAARLDIYAAASSNGNPEVKAKYLDKAVNFANSAKGLWEENYLPVKILGDIAIQKATTPEAAKSAAVKDYEQSLSLLEASENPSKHADDAKEMNVYLGTYYLGAKDTAKAKQYFQKALNIDPNNEQLQKFVSSLK